MGAENKSDAYLVISEASGIIVAAIGLFALTGWIFNVPLMKSILPGAVAMKANTAVCFILVGISLWALQTKRSKNKNLHILGNICASIALPIGILTLYEYMSGSNLGIDQLLFKEQPPAILTQYLGRMALVTAFNFLIISAAFLLWNLKAYIADYISQFLIAISGLVTLSALCGYLYGAVYFEDGLGTYTAMAVHTVIAFVFLFFGGFFARPDKGICRIVTLHGPGGTMLRVTLATLFTLPIFLGWAMLRGIAAGMYSIQFGVVMFMITGISIFSAVVLWASRYIENADVKQRAAQDIIDAANEEWRMTFDSMSDPAFIMDINNTIINVNSATAKLLNKKPKDIVGKKCYEMMHGTNIPIENCPMELAKKSNTPNESEVNDPHIGIPLIVTTSPILNNKKEVVGYVHVAKDISVIKKSEQALKDKIEELERFQKITVDRELKMKELKEKIAQLESALSRNKQ